MIGIGMVGYLIEDYLGNGIRFWFVYYVSLIVFSLWIAKMGGVL